MKKYIGIDSVDDIDLSKISVANINDRYLDKEGNRFATRFNLRTKKIQIVRVALGEEEAKKAKGKVVDRLVSKRIPVSTRKKEEKPSELEERDDLQPPDLSELGAISNESPSSSAEVEEEEPQPRKSIPDWIKLEGLSAAGAAMVNIGDYLAILDENYKLLSERLFGIINNIKNSGVMEKVAEIDDAIDFTNIFDHNIQPRMEETLKLRGEFEKYAERPEHYYTMIEKPFRNYLHERSELDIMDFLKAYFIGFSALGVLEETNNFIHSVDEKTKAADTSQLDASKKQFLEYAYSTCEYLANYIKEDTGKLLRWMKDQKVF